MHLDYYIYFLMPIVLVANLFTISQVVPHCRHILNAIVVQSTMFLIIFLSAVFSKMLFSWLCLGICIVSTVMVCWKPTVFGKYMIRSQHYLQIAWLYIFIALFFYGNPEKNLGHQIAIALWVSVDNNISSIISNLFVDYGADFWKKTILGDVIPISDRVSPALGLILPLRVWSGSDNLAMVAGIALQTLWVFPVAHLLRRAGGDWILRLMVVGSVPIIIFYSLYTWWKIYAAAIFLIALIFLIERKRIHVLAYLAALITHASHVFAVLALVQWKYLKSRPIFHWIGFCMLVALVLFYIVLPPSGQLVRWHIFGEPDALEIPIRTLIEQKIFTEDFAIRKISNFWISIFPVEIVSIEIGAKSGHSGLFLRYIQQYSFFFSFAYLMVFISRRASFPIKLEYLWFVITTFLITNFLEYGGPKSEAILHHRPSVELLLLLVILVLYMRKVGLLLAIGANIINWIFVWRPLQNYDGSSASLQYGYLLPYIVVAGLWAVVLTSHSQNSLIIHAVNSWRRVRENKG
jgi:hypothetical protein